MLPKRSQRVRSQSVISHYHPRMRVGNVFSRVCLSVQTITFELLHIGTLFLVWRYILTISRSSLSIMVIGSRSRLYAKMIIYLFQLVIPLYVAKAIKKVKGTHQGQGQIKVKIKLRSFFRRDTLTRVV